MILETTILIASISYLLGSIPFGLIVTKLGGHGDIRDIGSGNIGATNVLRTGSKTLALLTLIFDIGKGLAAVLIAKDFGQETVAAISVIVGHIFPIWLSFKGGKAVATAAGVLLALSWPVALIAAAIWLGVAFLTRYSSLASVIATTASPVIAYFLAPPAAVTMLVLALLIIYRHKENIERLIAGTESKIGDKKS